MCDQAGNFQNPADSHLHHNVTATSYPHGDDHYDPELVKWFYCNNVWQSFMFHNKYSLMKRWAKWKDDLPYKCREGSECQMCYKISGSMFCYYERNLFIQFSGLSRKGDVGNVGEEANIFEETNFCFRI
jgi:hypothetical protein